MSKEIEEIEGEDTLEVGNFKEIYPNATVKISKVQYSLFELKRKYENIERPDIILDPKFQRGSVWKKGKQRSELIESILMGIPIPIIYLFETKDGKKEVVDGRQRITTLINFLNNEFSLTDLKMLPMINGKKFQDLEPILQSKIEDYQLMAYVIQPPTPERVKYDIFDRVNRGGTQLNNQEMRNALYQGNATKLLDKLSELKSFQDATGNSIKKTRMKDKYIISRFIGFYLLRNKKIDIEYKSDIDDFLGKVMEYLNSFKNYDDIAYLEEVFDKTMLKAYKTLKSDGFRFKADKKKRPINMGLFETISYFFSLFDKQELNHEVLAEKINKLKYDFDDSGYFSNRVDSSVSVNYRLDKVERLKEEI